MLTQTKEVRDAWRASQRTLDIKVAVNGKTYTATDINSLKYDSGAYTGDTFAIGSTYSNNVQIEFSHLVEGLKLGMEVHPSIGIKTSKGYIYEPLGVFIISSEIKMDRNNNLTSISASDRFFGLEGTYKSKLVYPAKVLDIIAEICAQSGVKANADDLARLPHQADLPIPISGQSYRKALGWIAQLYAGYATFDRQGLFTIRTIAEPNYELDPSQYEQAGLTKNEAPYKIGGIQCQTVITTKTRDGENTEETKTYQVGDTSGSQIKLENNIMTPDRLNNIWEQIKDISFYPFNLNWFGNPAIEAGDWLRLEDKQGNKFIVPNNSYTLDFNGGLSATSKADQTSSTDSAISWRGTYAQIIEELQARKAPDGTVIFPPSVVEPPKNAKPNDVWFKQNGNSTELWVFTAQEDGSGKWIRRDLTPDEIKKQVQEAQSGLNDAKKQISDNLAKADGDIAELNASIRDQKKAFDTDIDELNASIRDQKKAFDTDIDELNASIRDQKGTIDGLSTTINTVAIPKITDVTNKVSDALTKINDQKNIVTELQNQATQQGKDISKITADVHGVTVDLANLNGDVNQTKATVQGLQSTLGNAQGDIAQIKVDAKKLETSLSSKVDNSTYATFVNQTNQALNAKLVASDLNGYAKTTELQATASGLQLNIDSVNGRLDNLKIGTRNLLHGTSDQYRALTNNDENGRLQKTTASSSITSVGHYLTGAQFTYAATLMNTNNQPVQLEACLCDNSGNPLPDSFYSSSVSNADNRPVSVTFSITQKTWFIRTWLVFPNNDGTQGEQVYVKDERLVEGTTPNTWSPNPDDTEQSLTQLSARITANSQRFSSYYTKSETDAKADTAKSDAVNTIKGDANWTGLTNIITNSGFLQSADGFVQKVQQTTLPMLNGGGVNLVKGTSNDWQTLTGSGRFQQTTSNYWYSTSYEKTGDQITYSIRIKNTSSYPVCAEIVGYDSNQSTRVTAAQSPVVQPGAEQSVSVTLTISSSTWWVGGWVVTQDSSTPQLSIQVKSEKLERGSVATPWTPNSAELVTQVAFTELTQTVNGLQSTVSGNYGDLQTRISQTDSAIREELSNQITGVTNQITTTASGLNARISAIKIGGQNLLHNTSNQYRTLTGAGWLYQTTASDMWTSTKYYLDGDQFTYSATITNTSEVPVRLALYCYYNDKKTMLKKVVGPTVGPNLRSVPTSVSITIDNSTWFICSDIETLDGQASSFSIQVKNEQLEEGNVKTAWTTNPDDIASQFTEVNATINGLQSTVGSNYSALQSQINQTATTIRGEVTNSANGLQTQITAATNGLSSITGRVGSLESLTNRQVLTSGIDANTMTISGHYFIKSTGNTNVPRDEWCFFDVETASGFVIQTWQWNNDPTDRYRRTLKDNIWSDWKRDVSYSEYSALNQTVQGLQSTVNNNYMGLQTQISQTAAAIRGELTDSANGLQTQITAATNGLSSITGRVGSLESLTNRQVLTSGIDANTMTISGHYFIKSTGNTNVPRDEWCFFDVETASGFVIQTWQWNNDPTDRYRRTLKDNIWSDWKRDASYSEYSALNQTVQGLQSTVGSNYSALQSQINQTATTIRGEVTNSANGLQTQITQQANNFNVSLNALRSETAWQKVTTAIDANNYTTTGNYWIQAAPNSNTPDGSAWAYLQVVAYSDVQRIKQTWQRDNNANEAYTRLKTGNDWSDWQKTVTSGNIMAQINVAAGTTLIQNDKIYMDASSTVFSGKAFIPDAAITNISADKINTGTLDAGRINVINLNANNITTGTINGANLKIDLNSGEILFQKGRIGSTNGYLNIDIDSGQMSVTNWRKEGFYFEDGELYLSDSFALTTNWKPKYGVIRRSLNPFTVGESGIEITSPTGVSLQTMNYDGAFGAASFLDQTKNGASVAIDRNGQALINAKQVGLTGGTFFSDNKFMPSKRRPRIVVGTDADASGLNLWGWGDPLSHVASRIVIDASYVHFPNSYNTTTGSAPNLCIASDGAIVRSTSASKYKTEIKRSYSTEYGEKLLNLPTAIWTDKGQKERYEAGKRRIKPEKYFGMIAEDLADAGLDLLVSRNPLTHEIEGIQYERIAPALLPVIKELKDKVNRLEKKVNE